MAEISESEWRSFAKVSVLIGKRAVDIFHNDLVAAMGDHAPSYETVRLWTQRFKTGRQSTEDDTRSGAPVTKRTARNIAAVRELIDEDPRLCGTCSSICGLVIRYSSTDLDGGLGT